MKDMDNSPRIGQKREKRGIDESIKVARVNTKVNIKQTRGEEIWYS